MIRIYFYTTFVFSLIAGLQAVSQTEEILVQTALANNRQIAAAQHLLDVARARVEQSFVLPDPELEAELEHDFIGNNEGESAFRVGVSQRFPFSKRLQHAESLSKLEMEIVDREIRKMQWLLVCDVREQCLQLRVIQSRISLQKRVLSLLQGWMLFVESRVQTGEISGLDASQIKLEVAEAAQGLHIFENRYSSSVSKLKKLVGIDQFVALDAALPDLSFGDVENVVPEISISTALNSRPDYQVASLVVESGDTAIELVRSEKWEDFSVGVSLTREKTIDEPVGSATNHFLGVGFSVPLPIRKANQMRVREKMAERAHAQGRLASIVYNIEQEIEIAAKEVERNLAQIASYSNDVLEEYDQYVRLNEEAYQSGQIDLSSLMRAQKTRLNLETQMIDNLRLYYTSVNRYMHLTASDPMFTPHN